MSYKATKPGSICIFSRSRSVNSEIVAIKLMNCVLFTFFPYSSEAVTLMGLLDEIHKILGVGNKDSLSEL